MIAPDMTSKSALGHQPPPITSKPPPLKRLRETHHRLAQLLAEGRKSVEISRITGYSQSRISILQNDPLFSGLLADYQDQNRAAFVDVARRLEALGLSAMEEIRDRLEMDPEGFSNKELLGVLKVVFGRGK